MPSGTLLSMTVCRRRLGRSHHGSTHFWEKSLSYTRIQTPDHPDYNLVPILITLHHLLLWVKASSGCGSFFTQICGHL